MLAVFWVARVLLLPSMTAGVKARPCRGTEDVPFSALPGRKLNTGAVCSNAFSATVPSGLFIGWLKPTTCGLTIFCKPADSATAIGGGGGAGAFLAAPAEAIGGTGGASAGLVKGMAPVEACDVPFCGILVGLFPISFELA